MTQVSTLTLREPQRPALSAAQRSALVIAIDAHRDRDGALLPILHAVQETLGFVPPAAVAEIAQALNLSRAEVHGVISFYHHFRSTAPGRHVVKLCRAEACQSVGAGALERHLQARLGVGYGDTTGDGAITLEPVYCLGNCACAPSALVDDELHGRLTPAGLDALIDALVPAP